MESSAEKLEEYDVEQVRVKCDQSIEQAKSLSVESSA